MKLIAHRGWCEGAEENTAAAFARAAADRRISGVEFDIRRAPGSSALIVSHDPPAGAGAALALDDALALLAPSRLELLVELKEPAIAEEVIGMLVAHGAADRSVLFAFPAVAHSFPWPAERPVRLGVIVEYPWQLSRMVREHAPDVLLLGWDARAWTRLAFRAWWSLFSLERLGRRHRVPVIVGVVQRDADLAWLSHQSVYAAVADMDRLAPRLARAAEQPASVR